MNIKEEEKKNAAKEASLLVKDGQTIGLGTGSTVNYLIEALSKRKDNEKFSIKAVPTSNSTADYAQRFGIQLTTLFENPELDIGIDGADQVDPNLNLIKGLGGALTREKIVASASRQFVIIIDESKMTEKLGEAQVLPVEVIPFSIPTVTRKLEKLGGKPILRIVKGNNDPYVTDNSNQILDVNFCPISNPRELETKIKMIPGVVEHGLFIGMANALYVGMPYGVQRIWK